jgi:hypothetical protein
LWRAPIEFQRIWLVETVVQTLADGGDGEVLEALWFVSFPHSVHPCFDKIPTKPKCVLVPEAEDNLEGRRGIWQESVIQVKESFALAPNEVVAAKVSDQGPDFWIVPVVETMRAEIEGELVSCEGGRESADRTALLKN